MWNEIITWQTKNWKKHSNKLVNQKCNLAIDSHLPKTQQKKKHTIFLYIKIVRIFKKKKKKTTLLTFLLLL